jgi:hypothetical protein
MVLGKPHSADGCQFDDAIYGVSVFATKEEAEAKANCLSNQMKG